LYDRKFKPRQQTLGHWQNPKGIQQPVVPPLLIFEWRIEDGAKPVVVSLVSHPIAKGGFSIVGFVCQSNEK
jgi:hypothetical protein